MSAREEGLGEAVEALAEEWECEPLSNRTDDATHIVACPDCFRGDQLRALLAERLATPAEVEPTLAPVASPHRRGSRPCCVDHPAEPDTGDVSEALTEAERESLAIAARSTNIATSDLQLDAIAVAVGRIVAARERKAAEQAWDEGATAAWYDCQIGSNDSRDACEMRVDNPYLADRIAGDA